MKDKTYKDIIIKTSNMNPYKEEGNRESYSSYNEGWSDACDVILAEIEEMGQVESKRPNIQDYKKRATGWYKDNGDDYDNDLQNYIDLLEEKLSQHPTEQPSNTRELSAEEIIKISEKYANEYGGSMFGLAYKSFRAGIEYIIKNRKE